MIPGKVQRVPWKVAGLVVVDGFRERPRFQVVDLAN